MNIRATLDHSSRPRYLMCPPRHFAVTYSINPWMDPKAWAETSLTLYPVAARQWEGLHLALTRHGAVIEKVEPAIGLPDLVFTANAAVVLDGKALLTRFRHPERRGEEPIYASAFHSLKERGLIEQVIEMPEGTALEGAGDCIWDSDRSLFWMGYGFRSDFAASAVVERTFGVECVPLELANPSYYHLDTAFCPLPDGGVIYYPGAFTTEALAEIEARVEPAYRIPLDAKDAGHFAANAAVLGMVVVLSSASDRLRRALFARGYTVVETPLTVFQKSGGSACCLTLRLDRRALVTASR
ncbi:MAG: arginine deiminase-related protein [Pseudorhodoplanes sp.]